MKFPTTKILPNLQGRLNRGELDNVEYGNLILNINILENHNKHESKSQRSTIVD